MTIASSHTWLSAFFARNDTGIDAAGQERVRQQGAAAVLSKPLVPEELLLALAATLQQ
jgi:CheY-like chemotaxis protein